MGVPILVGALLIRGGQQTPLVVNDLDGQTRQISRRLHQRVQAGVTGGEISQLPLELASDAVKVAPALRQ
jgi:hypothetical protein